MTATVLGKPKGLMSVATKVVVQMNCKLGGEPWAVDIPLKNTMIIGYDTYHDSQHKTRSVGALVASLNKTMTKYLSSAEFHENQSELTDRMVPGIAKALRKYHELNKTWPERVIMYRCHCSVLCLEP
jgi:aubergine-like protein